MSGISFPNLSTQNLNITCHHGNLLDVTYFLKETLRALQI